jgi:hypothetical protein
MGTTPPPKYTPTLHPASELGTGDRVYKPIMNKKDYNSSNRRKFLIGAGSVVAGASALFGTAATTTFNLNDRAVSANVVTDSSGAVALTDDEPGDIIKLTSDELEIDFTEGGASGVNIGSVVNIGNFSNPNNDPAFTITNQTTAEVDLKVEFKGDGFSANASGSTLKFALVDTDTSTQKTLTADANNVAGPNDTESVEFLSSASEGIASGENLDVAIDVNADNSGSGTGENLSGVLNITATQG